MLQMLVTASPVLASIRLHGVQAPLMSVTMVGQDPERSEDGEEDGQEQHENPQVPQRRFQRSAPPVHELRECVRHEGTVRQFVQLGHRVQHTLRACNHPKMLSLARIAHKSQVTFTLLRFSTVSFEK